MVSDWVERDGEKGKVLCEYCRLPVLGSDYTSIPAHVVCVLRVMDRRREVVARMRAPKERGSGRQRKEWRTCARCRVIKFAVVVMSPLFECRECRGEG